MTYYSHKLLYILIIFALSGLMGSTPNINLWIKRRFPKKLAYFLIIATNIFIIALTIVLYIKFPITLPSILTAAIGAFALETAITLRTNLSSVTQKIVIPLLLLLLSAGMFGFAYNNTMNSYEHAMANQEAKKANSYEAQQRKKKLKQQGLVDKDKANQSNKKAAKLPSSAGSKPKNNSAQNQQEENYKKYYANDSENLDFIESHVNRSFGPLNLIDVNHKHLDTNKPINIYAVMSLNSANSKQFMPVFAKASQKYNNYQFIALFPINNSSQVQQYLQQNHLKMNAATNDVNTNVLSNMILKDFLVRDQKVSSIPTTFVVNNNKIKFTRIGALDDATLQDVINQGTQSYAKK